MGKSLQSPWFFFWFFVGGFYFAFQAFIYLSHLPGGDSNTVEIFAIIGGFSIALIIGYLVSRYATNTTEDGWQIPRTLFGLWVLVPAVFPLLFLIGLFSHNNSLINLPLNPYQQIFELCLFATGLVLLFHFVRIGRFTQGSVSIVFLSLLFMMKIVTTDVFYLTHRCPRMVVGSQYSESILTFNQPTKAALDETTRFYQTPIGAFICSKTSEQPF